MNTIIQVDVNKLTPHPENERIYRDRADQDLITSVQEKGVINPLLVSFDFRIINGHRRWDAAKRAGLSEVPALVFLSDDELDILEALIESNRQRVKTNEQIGREAKLLLEIEKDRAERRRLANLKNVNIDVNPDQHRDSDTVGKSGDIVGEKLGYSGRHVSQAAAVVNVIDDLEDQGREKEANRLRATLNQSVKKAHQRAKDNGHIPTTPKPAQKPQAPALPDFITLEQWNNMRETEQQEALFNTPTKGKFNEQKNDNIEWAKWSWNPVTGCLHNCDYCYARDIAARFYPQKFVPSLIPSRLGIPDTMKVPSDARYDIGWKNVFTCSMADLFGKWVPAEWINAVLEQVHNNPQWNFLFLTKFPIRMAEFEFPDNAWVGTTVDRQYAVERAEKAFQQIDAAVKFLSCEPMLEPLQFTALDMFDWVIIGGSSESTQTPEFFPDVKWIGDLEWQAREAGCKIYEKPNLWRRPLREYPGQ